LPGARKVEAFYGQNVVTQGETSITVWDAVTGKERKSWKRSDPFIRHQPRVWIVADELLVLLTHDHTITVWDADTFAERFRFPGIDYQQIAVFGTAQVKLLAAAQEGSVTVWDLTTGRKRGSFLLPLDRQYTSDPARCPTTGELMSSLKPLDAQCQQLRFTSDGSRLVALVDHSSASPLIPKPLRLYDWDVSTVPFPESGFAQGREVVTFPVGCLSADGRWLWSMDQGPGSWQLNAIDTPDLAITLDKLSIGTPTIAPDSRSAAGWTWSRPRFIDWLLGNPAMEDAADLMIWQVPGGRELAALRDCSDFMYFPDGKSLATWSADGTMQIWDIPPRRPWSLDYSLPVVFVLLIILGCRLVWRFHRVPPDASSP
jgi:WD40 repeat protein